MNRARERQMTVADADKAYAAVGVLNRLARSQYGNRFYLKGGHLVASLLDQPHRATRDVDMLHADPHAPDVDYIRQVFRSLARIRIDDGLAFRHDDVTARRAERELDDYDGVKVVIRASIENAAVDVHIDIGFGDAVVPDARRARIPPFIDGQASPYVFAYPAEAQIAEKTETMLTKMAPHRLKDIVDVILLARCGVDEEIQTASIRATFQRRGTNIDVARAALEELQELPKHREWQTHWHTMLRDKAVQEKLEFQDAVGEFVRFVERVLK